MRADAVFIQGSYFHGLWEKRAVTLTHLSIPVRQHLAIEVGLAQKWLREPWPYHSGGIRR